MEYQVDLDTFRGPLDLLLYLVKRQEVDICDIPIARIAGQFLEYVQVIERLDVEWAGEFLVMAATLMEIKSRMLLPRSQEEEEEEEDPRQELVRQLLEYKSFKEAAVLLESRAEEQLSRLPRQVPAEAAPLDPAQQPLRRVELWDLVSAFGRLMRETLALQPTQIVLDETPQQVHMDEVLGQLSRQPRLTLKDLFQPPHTRSRLLGLFLAILELIKSRQIVAEQPEPFGEIWIHRAPPAEAQPTLEPDS
jgi:segregation and condensation protein A